MASSKVQVYNVLPEMCTVGGVSEICLLFGLKQKKVVKFDKSEGVQKHEKTVTLTLTLSEEVSLSKDRIDYQGRQLFAMPEMVDGAVVTLNKLWTDKLKPSELKNLVDNNVKLVTSNGIVTLGGDAELVYNNVEKIKGVILNTIMDTEPKKPQDAPKHQPRGHGDERKENNCGRKVFNVTAGSDALEETNGKAPETDSESESHSSAGRSAPSEDPDDDNHYSKRAGLMGKLSFEDQSNNSNQLSLTTPSSHTTNKHETAKKTSVPNDSNARGVSVLSISADTYKSTPVGAQSVSKKVQSKVETTDRNSTQMSATKHVISEPLWEFIKFSYPDCGWGSKFSDVRTHGNGGQLELAGAAADVAELDRFCSLERLRGVVVFQAMKIPKGYTFETFKELVVGSLYKRNVLVRTTNNVGYCELIGRKNDVQEVIRRAEKDLPRNTAVDDDGKNEHFKQQTLANPTSAGDDDASRKSLSLPIPYISTSDKLEFETQRSKVKVTVVTGDILKQSCEVIVSPTNTSLFNNQGLAQIIELAAGRETTDDIHRFLATYHRLNVSEVMKTRAGKLFPPCRSIIHACGPDIRFGSTAEDCFDPLRTTFLKCFVLANDDIKARSIAVPAISAGAAGLPLDVVARAAYSALMSFDEGLANGQRKLLESICFVNIDKETSGRMIKAFTDGLSCSSSASGAQGTHLPSAANMATNSKFVNTTTSPSNNSPLVKNNPAAALDKPEFVTPKSNVKVSFVTGDLLEQRCEVLVCPTDGTSSNISRLAKALDSKAGRGPRDEYSDYIRRHGDMQVTEVMDTGPGTLNPPVERIMYAVGPLKFTGSSHSQCFDLLRTTFLKCYIHANEYLQARSIAVPSISPVSGSLGLPYDVISGALSASLLLFDDYLRNAPVRHLGIICVADLSPDMIGDMIQRFQAELSRLKPTTGVVKRNDSDNLNLPAQTSTTSNLLTGDSTPSNSSSVRIHPPITLDKSEFVTPKSKIKVIVVTDDVLEQRCEVLVCPTDANLNNTSRIAQTIQSRAGRESEKDCTDYFINLGSLRVTQIMDTRPGRLNPPTKRIIFACGPHMRHDSTLDQCCTLLRTTFLNCFVHANDRIQVRSIAVPAFGKGLIDAYDLSRDAIARAATSSLLMFDEHLSNVRDKHLELICFANEDSELTTRMVEAFQKEMSPATTYRDVQPDNKRSQISTQPNAVRHTSTELEKRAKEHGSTWATDEWLKGNRSHRGDTHDERDERDQQGKYKITNEDSQQRTSKTTATSSEPACAICMDDIQKPKKLRCGHVFCTDCIDQHFEYQMKCPCCGQIFGELKGDQPKGGTMHESTEFSSLEGYPGCGRIVINYDIPGGNQQANHPNPGKWYKGARRTAYLPDNTEGRQICALLRIAFDAGLIFTVGRSTTSGQEDVVTWNDIHHKTKPTGPYGYPDPNYLARVRDELAAKGISSATASSTTTSAAAAANHVTSANCPPSAAPSHGAPSSTSTKSAGATLKSTANINVGGKMTTWSRSPVNSSTILSTGTTKVGQHQTPPFTRSSSYTGSGSSVDSSTTRSSAGLASSSSSTTTITQPVIADPASRRKRDPFSSGVEGSTRLSAPPDRSRTHTVVSDTRSQLRQLTSSPLSDASGSGIGRSDGSSSRPSVIGKSVSERQKVLILT